MLEEATADLPNVRVAGFDGLIVDLSAVASTPSRSSSACAGAGDYEYELPMAQMNSHLTSVETVFLPGAVGKRVRVVVSLIKEVAALGGDVHGLVPERGARAAGASPRRAGRLMRRGVVLPLRWRAGYDSEVVLVSRRGSSQ